MAYTKFHKNWPLTTRVTRWSTLKTLNRVFSISQKWDLPGYSTKPFNWWCLYLRWKQNKTQQNNWKSRN